jgi:hypothetical protein
MTDAQWTEAEREAAVEAELVELCQNEYPDRDIASKILAALAPFLAARVAEARADGMREAAGIARVHAAAAKRCADEGDVIHRIRAEYLANSFALNAAADDILAAIEPKEPTT